MKKAAVKRKLFHRYAIREKNPQEKDGYPSKNRDFCEVQPVKIVSGISPPRSACEEVSSAALPSSWELVSSPASPPLELSPSPLSEALLPSEASWLESFSSLPLVEEVVPVESVGELLAVK